MNIYLVSSVLAFTVSCFLSLIIYLKGSQVKSRNATILIILCAGIWCLFPFFAWWGWPDNTLLFTRIVYLVAIFTAPAFLNFGLTILDTKRLPKERFLIRSSILISAFLFLPFFYSSFFIKGVKKVNSYFSIDGGPLYKLFIFYFGAVCIYCFYRLYFGIKNSNGYLRNQLKYVFIGFLLAFFSGLIHFLTSFGLPEIIPHDFLVVACMFILTYAILKYHLLDINIALTRAGVFIIVYTLVLGIPFGLVGWGKDWLIYFLGQNWYWAPMLLLLGLATCGPFTYIYLSRKAEERFLKEERHAHQLLKQASQGMVRIHDKKRLLELIVHITTKILGLSNAAVFLLDENSGNFKLAAVRFKSKYQYSEVIPQDDPLVQLLATQKEPLVYEELKLANQDLSSDTPNQLKEIDSQMRKLKAAVIIPAVSNARLLAFLVLSEKKSKKMYSPEDLSTLWALSYEAALAIDNAFLYEKEKLRLAEQSRRQALADMAPGASHQFNNRLATISATTDNLLDLVKNDSQGAYQDNLLSNILEGLEIIQKEVAKGEQITKAILQKAKVKLEFDKVDIVKVIQNALNLIRIRRTRESLGGAKEPEFVFNYPKDLPLLTLCEGTIQDVFENMFNNSYDAIVIKHKRHIAPLDYQGKISVDITRNDNSVIIQVEDNGIGIQKDNLRKLFTDFFTTKATSEKGVVGGSGLGLGVMRSFIEEHGGTITAESEYTQWTRFTITLPLNFKPPK